MRKSAKANITRPASMAMMLLYSRVAVWINASYTVCRVARIGGKFSPICPFRLFTILLIDIYSSPTFTTHPVEAVTGHRSIFVIHTHIHRPLLVFSSPPSRMIYSHPPFFELDPFHWIPVELRCSWTREK